MAAAPLQNDHRHVTPMPVETLSPVSALSMARGSIRIAIDAKNAIEATNESHAAVVAHTSYEEQVLTAYNSYSTSEYFPAVVQRMISENCQMYNGSLMHWTDCGKFFSVNANHAKLSSVIGKHFKRKFRDIYSFADAAISNRISLLNLLNFVNRQQLPVPSTSTQFVRIPQSGNWKEKRILVSSEFFS